MASSPLEALKQKYMKDPDIIPAKGEDKEPIAEAMAQQQVRQRENNDRAFELLTKAGSNEVDSGSSGGAKEGGDAAMYRLTEYVQKPVEKNTELDRKIWGKPKKQHLKIMNRPLEIMDKDEVDKLSLDPPPVFDSDQHKTEIQNLKELRGLLDQEAVLERVEKQDEDLLFPFNKYLRENNLEIDREEFMKIMRDVNTIIFKFKYYFNRPRPHQYSDLDEIENKGGKSPSYPSGHSTTGAVIAELLSEQFPEHSEDFRVMGTELGYNRIIAGLHHMSDHLAGLQLASQIIPLIIDTKITKSDEFMNELFKYMKHREELFKDMTQIGTQDILDGVRIDKESNPRVPRKKGQPAKSKKHSDLYTDEDPKGTIQGLGFKDDKTAKASVKKIKDSGRTHAHKIQAAVAMEQRAKAAGKSSEAGIYRKYIDSMKEKTKRLEKHSEEHHGVEHVAEEKPFSMEAAKESLNEQLEQIQNKLITGDYGIKKSDDIFLFKQDYDVTKPLTKTEFKKLYDETRKFSASQYMQDLGKHFAQGLGGIQDTAEQRGAAIPITDFFSSIGKIGLGVSPDNAYKVYKQGVDEKLKDAFKMKPVDTQRVGEQQRQEDKQKVQQAKEAVRQQPAQPETSQVEEAPAEEAPKAEEPATEEAPAQEPPAETGATTPDFEVLGVMTEYGHIGKDYSKKILTAVLRDKDGQIRIASQSRRGAAFKPNDGFSAYNYLEGTMPIHANSRYHGKNKESFPINLDQLNEMESDLRGQAVSFKDIKTNANVPKGMGFGAEEAAAFNNWIKNTVAENTDTEWNLPEVFQNQIDNPSASSAEYTKNVQKNLLDATGETPPPQQETVETPPEQPVQPVQEQAPAEQPTVEQPAETAVQEPVTTPETPVVPEAKVTPQEPIDERQAIINQADESGLLDHYHEKIKGYDKDNAYHSREATVAKLLDKYKTPADLNEELGKADSKFIAFKAKQKADAQKLIDETTAQQQAAEAQAQAPNPQEIAENIANEVNEMPTLFQRDAQGNITPTATASNANMADRYRRLRKLINLHGGVDEAETGLKNSVQAELDKINPNIKQKIEADLKGMRDNLPVGIKRKLANEHSRNDYHEDSHKQEITAARQQSAAKEVQNKAEMKDIHKKRLDDDLFKGDAHDKHQTLRNHTENEENKFQDQLKEKFSNPDSPNFKEGGHTKSDEAAERRAQGIPPQRPSGVPATHLWHAGSHHWVTPEYMKLHPDIGAGAVKGDVVTGLDNIKDSEGNQAFIAGDRAAQNNGIAAIKANKNQGLGGSDLVITNQKASRNEHGHIDYSNVDYHADDDGAAHSGKKNHYVEQHLAEGQDRVKTDSTGRKLTSDAGNTALQRYGARLKDAGGFTGALARFKAAVLPSYAGGGLTSDQAAQYTRTDFKDE